MKIRINCPKSVAAPISPCFSKSLSICFFTLSSDEAIPSVSVRRAFSTAATLRPSIEIAVRNSCSAAGESLKEE